MVNVSDSERSEFDGHQEHMHGIASITLMIAATPVCLFAAILKLVRFEISLVFIETIKIYFQRRKQTLMKKP